MRKVQGELVCVGDSAVVCVRQEVVGDPDGHPGHGHSRVQSKQGCERHTQASLKQGVVTAGLACRSL